MFNVYKNCLRVKLFISFYLFMHKSERISSLTDLILGVVILFSSYVQLQVLLSLN